MMNMLLRFSMLVSLVFLGLLWNLEARQIKDDTTNATLRHYLRQGDWSGDMRYYFMATDNHNPALSDYYAHAAGLAISYRNDSHRRLSLGTSMSFIHNVASSDLTTPDPLTGQFNRYEIGLFDIDNPGRRLIGRIDELYVQYRWGQSRLTFGKQMLITPWLNPQDGRMRPNFQEGIYLDFRQLKRLRIEAAWIYKFLVRSTTRWLTIAESIGQYPSGVTPDGVRSEYKNNLSSLGLGILGIHYEWSPSLKLQLWNYFTENIFNTSMLQIENEWGAKEHPYRWVLGMQAHYQFAVRDGGNSEPNLAYIQAGKRSWAVSGRAAWKHLRRQISLNYTHIGDAARFLFPREWGRDPFYTFLPRERNEGYGGLHAFMVQAHENLPRIRSQIHVGYGHYYLPSPENTRLNKYAFPSYWQLNVQLQHQLDGFLEGLRLQFLYVHKEPLEGEVSNPRWEFNKVNLSLYNLVVNYTF